MAMPEVNIQKFDPSTPLSVNNITQSGINQDAAKYYTMIESSLPTSKISEGLTQVGGAQLINAGVDARVYETKTDGKYHCAVCDNVFNRKQNLKAHLVTHTEKKPFTCTFCGCSFRRPYDLRRHERIHTKEKPFTCSACNKTFPRKDALNRHIKSGSGCLLKRKSIHIDNSKQSHALKKKALKTMERQLPFEDPELIETNNENNFFIQQSLQEAGKITETESNHRKIQELVDSEMNPNNLSSKLISENMNVSPLSLSLISEVMSLKSQNKGPINNETGSSESQVQLSERQMQLLRMILEKLQNLDKRVTRIEQLFEGKLEFFKN